MKFILRPLLPADRHAIAKHANNIKIWNQVRDIMPYPYRPNDASDFIAYIRTNPKEIIRGIEVNNEVVGIIGLTLQSDVYRLNGELGFWLGEALWGKGIMSKAVGKMCELGYKDYNLHRIFAEVFDRNIASIRVLEKNGFHQEAILKEAVIKNGKILDMHILSRIKEKQ